MTDEELRAIERRVKYNPAKTQADGDVIALIAEVKRRPWHSPDEHDDASGARAGVEAIVEDSLGMRTWALVSWVEETQTWSIWFRDPDTLNLRIIAWRKLERVEDQELPE